ncbi:MAG TPA: hypothetical protein VGF76_08755 [Polyangiaceae bacterium]
MTDVFILSALGLLGVASVACSGSKAGDSTSTHPVDAGGASGFTQEGGASSLAGLSSAGNGASSGGNNGSAGSAGGTPAQGGGAIASAGSAGQPELGPLGPAPDFGPNVLIFDGTKDMATTQAQIKTISDQQASAQFSSNRYALLFKPGKYQLDVKIGFYMQVLGLGATPDDVQVTGAVRARSDWNNGNATLNFWREAENISAVPMLDNNANTWAVSQGTALRRAHLMGPLNLSDGGYASGGYIADTLVDGVVASGAQQQFFTRNSSWTSWNGGVWNMVFSGIDNAPPDTWPAKPYTVTAKTPVIREKPYLTIDADGL